MAAGGQQEWARAAAAEQCSRQGQAPSHGSGSRAPCQLYSTAPNHPAAHLTAVA